jgi:hypothetical protein
MYYIPDCTEAMVEFNLNSLNFKNKFNGMQDTTFEVGSTNGNRTSGEVIFKFKWRRKFI